MTEQPGEQATCYIFRELAGPCIPSVPSCLYFRGSSRCFRAATGGIGGNFCCSIGCYFHGAVSGEVTRSPYISGFLCHSRNLGAYLVQFLLPCYEGTSKLEPVSTMVQKDGNGPELLNRILERFW